MSDYLRYNEDDHRNPTSDHDELTADLVHAVTEYFRALGSGDSRRLNDARTNLNLTERAYHDSYGNPRDVIDPQDPKVIAAHADLVATIAFNPHADAVTTAFERIVDLDNDRFVDRNHSPYARSLNRDELDRQMHLYTNYYPSAPTPEELAYIRRALTPRVVS